MNTDALLDSPPITIRQSARRLLGQGVIASAIGLALMATPLLHVPLGAGIGFGLIGALVLFIASTFFRKINAPNVLMIDTEGLDITLREQGKIWRGKIPWKAIDRFEVLKISRSLSVVGMYLNEHYVPHDQVEAGLYRALGGMGTIGGQWPGGSGAIVEILTDAQARWGMRDVIMPSSCAPKS